MQFIRRILVLVMLASSALVALPTAASAAEPVWTITARGNGHGLGMSQYGASGMANAGYLYQQIFTTYYQNTTIAGQYNGRSEPRMNVGIVGVGDAALRGGVWTVETPTYPIVIGGVTLPKGRYYLDFNAGNGTVTPLDMNWAAVNAPIPFPADGLVVYEASGMSLGVVALGEPSGSRRLIDEPDSCRNIAYEGALVFTGSGQSYTVKNRVWMESYLNGVVPREMPASWHGEALKAQALAARSYALSCGFTNPATDLDSKLVACTESFQVYNGYGKVASGTLARYASDKLYAANITAAVAGTVGQVGVSGGKVITAYFSSSAGGYTENAENVWSGALSYIKGITEPYPNTPPSHIVTKTFTASQLVAAIRKQTAWASQVPADAVLTGFRISKTGFSPRPTEITITTANYGTKVLTGNTPISNFCRTNGLGFLSTYIEVVSGYAPSGKTSRIWGDTQYNTSVEASKKAFPIDGNTRSVIVAAGPIDALTASGLAGVLSNGAGGPILVTSSTSLDASVRAEIQRLGANGVYIVGGTSVLQEQVEEQLEAIPGVVLVHRLAGSTLFGTAYEINKEMKFVAGVGGLTVGTRAIVLNGNSGIDAVGAAGFAFAQHVPIIPVEAASIPASSTASISDLGITQSLVVGGDMAVTPAVKSKLPAVSCIAAGSTLYQTAAILANYLVSNEGFTYSGLYVSSGESMIDGISAGPVAGMNKNPLILTPRASSEWNVDYVVYTNRATIKNLYILGGVFAVTTDAEKTIDSNFLRP